jgi:hypothetical protein
MTAGKRKDSFLFYKPGIYRIQVYGTLGESLSGCLGHMSIVTTEGRDCGTTTSIEGIMRDQAELCGVLNMLYEHHFMLMSVKYLGPKE